MERSEFKDFALISENDLDKLDMLLNHHFGRIDYGLIKKTTIYSALGIDKIILQLDELAKFNYKINVSDHKYFDAVGKLADCGITNTTKILKFRLVDKNERNNHVKV